MMCTSKGGRDSQRGRGHQVRRRRHHIRNKPGEVEQGDKRKEGADDRQVLASRLAHPGIDQTVVELDDHFEQSLSAFRFVAELAGEEKD